jgi:hypothetical protein
MRWGMSIISTVSKVFFIIASVLVCLAVCGCDEPASVPSAPTVTITPEPVTYAEAPDMIWVGTDYHGRVGGDFDGINVIYYSKYVFAESRDDDVQVNGRVIMETDGVFGPPIEYSWAKTFQRNTQYHPDTMGVIKAIYLTVPRTAAPGDYTGSITVTDNFGNICTKLFTFTIER